MRTNDFRPVSFDDVIFENRNRAYGAYDIRKHYETHLKTALTIALSIFLLLIFSPKIMQYFSPEIKIVEVIPPICDLPVIKPGDVILPKNVIPEQKPLPASPPAPSIRYQVPTVVDRIIIHDEIPTNQQLQNSDALIGSENRAGDPNSTNITDKKSDITGDGSGGAGIIDDNFTHIWVEQMPNFAGGDAALNKFIAENVRYPNYGLEYNLEGVVWVMFTVGKDGKVIDPKIIKSVRGGFDEEALRVIKMMPAWKPGKQNGREVPVYVKLPIKFTLKN